ncbi:MAG: Holliday junction branch migration protein RuvA, partial [Candidatus Peregrinibacteria bacterium]
MIAYLKGTILKKEEKSLVVLCGSNGNSSSGVGYLVKVSAPLLQEVKENDEISLFIHTHVREDAFDLFGFKTYEEFTFFKKLISISGIGPKTGQDIVSLPLNKLKSAIINGDTAFITTVPKVGKKIADRMILELKNKLDFADFDTEDLDRQHSNLRIPEEVITALEKLGYNRKEISKVTTAIPAEITSSEEIIKF